MNLPKVFADLSGREPGVPDGMKVDTAGNVYCGGSGVNGFSIRPARSSAASFTAIARQ
jgi:sugar lactone lactonase YvrE